MLKQTINKWSSSLDSFKNGDNNGALNALKSVDPTSKIQYNIGIIYCKMGNYREAIDHFTKSTELDKFMAISYFMRGVCYQQCDDRNHAIVDFDEAITKLRGHEFIDYSQLGLNFRLLLTEVLFNKAISLGSAGGSVASQAQQCSTMPSDPGYREQLQRLVTGQSAKFRTAPLDQLFKPPRVSDSAPPKPKTEQLSSPMLSSSAPSGPSYLSGSPPKPISLTSSGSSLPTMPSGASTSSPAPPPPTISRMAKILPTPAGGSNGRTLPSPSAPVPPPPPSTKRLPSRPISMMVQEPKITIKCFYTDRRLIQLIGSCTIDQLKEKIEAKFQESSLIIRYKSSVDGNFSTIKYQKDLDYALKIEVNELYLSRDGQPNSYEADAAVPAGLYRVNNSNSSYNDNSNYSAPTPSPRQAPFPTLKRSTPQVPNSQRPSPSSSPPKPSSPPPSSSLNKSGVRNIPIIPPRPSASSTPPKPASVFVYRQQQQQQS